MKISRVARQVVAGLLVAIACVPAAHAQVTEGLYTGTVHDGSGTAEPGATVVVMTTPSGAVPRVSDSMPQT